MSDLATNSAIITSELTTASRIYVELGFIKHLQLGSMLASKIDDRESYDRLIEFIYSDTFNNRITDDITRFIDIHLGKGKVTDRNVMILSPLLTGSKLIIAFTGVASETKTMIDPKDEGAITLVINGSQLKELPDSDIDQVEDELSEMFQSNVIYDTKPVEEYTDKEMLQFDAYFINDIYRFNKRFIDRLNDFSFLPKQFHVQKLVPSEKYELFVQNDPEEQFNDIFTIMSTACEFNFLAESAIVDP